MAGNSPASGSEGPSAGQLLVTYVLLGVLGLVIAAALVGPDRLLGFIESAAGGLWSLSATQVSLLQTALAVIGGLWALYLYRTTRAGQTTVSTVPTFWLSKSLVDDFWVLVVGTKVTNVSKVVCRDCTARITLMDATIRDPHTGSLVLPEFAEQDAWALLDPPAADLDPELELEPGEVITSEVAFLLSRKTLLAVRIAVDGKQGFLRREFEWNTVIFVDTAALQPQAWGAAPADKGTSNQPPAQS